MNRLFRKILILFIAVFVLLAHVPSGCRNTVMAEEDDSAIVEPAEEAAETDETANEEMTIVQEEHEEETVTETPAETAEEETVYEEYEETVSENEETEEIVEEMIEADDDENVEETETAPETEEEIEYGPHEFIEDDVNGLYIRVTDSEGAFPVETVMKTEPVAVEEVFDVISGLVENTISEITAVDISFWYEDEEIEPILPVDVEIRVNGAEEDVEQQIVHIDDDNKAELVKAVMNNDGEMTIAEFTVDGFSTYAFVKSGGNSEESETRYDPETIVIASEEGLLNVVVYLNENGGSKTVIMTEDITLTTDDRKLKLNNGQLTILGEGHKLTAAVSLSGSAVMNMGQDGYENTLLITSSRSDNGVFDITDSSVLNVYGGTTIGPARPIGTAGGIQAHGTSVINMYGGVITDCQSSSVAGGVYLDQNSTFNMYDGKITNCTGSFGAVGLSGGSPIGPSGAGVATFNMNGGTISNCVSNYIGGGAICAWTSFPVNISINGGTIENCSYVGNYGYGGAVCLYTSANIDFTMNGGTITGSSCDGRAYGGGVFIYAYGSSSDIKFNAGTIKNNSAKYGGGIMAFDGDITIANGFGLHNNTVSNGGDDIYNAGATITLGTADTSASLDGCGHKITGWYMDDGPRWSYESCTGEEDYLELFAHVGEAYSGEYGLKAAHGEIVNTYTITWANYDGTVLETDEGVEEGTMPTYDSATPTRPATSQYTYTFAGWSPEVTEAGEDITYTATYTATEIPDPSGGGSGGGDTPSQPASGGGVTPVPQPTPEPDPVPEPEPAPEPEPEPTPDPGPTIDPDPTPAGLNSSWALVNLILTVLTALLAAGMIATRKKKEESEEDKDKKNNAKLLGLIPAIVSIVVFLVTENMKSPMVMTDKYTVVMAAIAIAGILLAYFTRNRKQTQDPEPQLS